MPFIARTSVAVTVVGLAFWLIVIQLVDAVAPGLPGFGSSSNGWTSSDVAACSKGQHFPDPTIV
jgi:hypothetical protein